MYVLPKSCRSKALATDNRDHIVHLSTSSTLKFTSQHILSLRVALVDNDGADGRGTMERRWYKFTQVVLQMATPHTWVSVCTPGSLPVLYSTGIACAASKFVEAQNHDNNLRRGFSVLRTLAARDSTCPPTSTQMTRDSCCNVADLDHDTSHFQTFAGRHREISAHTRMRFFLT
jgi:hypothetical protein